MGEELNETDSEDKKYSENIIKDAEALLAAKEKQGGSEPALRIQEFYKKAKILQEKTDGDLFPYMEKINPEEIDEAFKDASTYREEMDAVYNHDELSGIINVLVSNTRVLKPEEKAQENESLCIHIPGTEMPEGYGKYMEEFKEILDGNVGLEYSEG